MDKILSVFEFSSQSWGLLFARFGIELLCAVLVTYLVAVIILQFTKKKEHTIGFTNWFKVCFMYGIDAAVVALGIIVILTIRANGLYYFETLSWSWYCGYLLMSPEFLVMIGLIALYVALDHQVKKSIN